MQSAHFFNLFRFFLHHSIPIMLWLPYLRCIYFHFRFARSTLHLISWKEKRLFWMRIGKRPTTQKKAIFNSICDFRRNDNGYFARCYEFREKRKEIKVKVGVHRSAKKPLITTGITSTEMKKEKTNEKYNYFNPNLVDFFCNHLLSTLDLRVDQMRRLSDTFSSENAVFDEKTHDQRQLKHPTLRTSTWTCAFVRPPHFDLVADKLWVLLHRLRHF